mgnify:CR=1 FL=1
MPPRRSCFPRRRAPSRPGLREFQCHHGVPASNSGLLCDHPLNRRFNATTAFLLPMPRSLPCVGRSPVSMPPRRSCFQDHKPDGGPPGLLFQCHHGVPASFVWVERVWQRHIGFNATTAFLLPSRPPPSWRSSSLVSMPPRRSCFPERSVFWGSWKATFQCHHGVPASFTFSLSCAPYYSSFNATTAFLLPPLYHGIGDFCQVWAGTLKGTGIVGCEHRSVSTATSPFPVYPTIGDPRKPCPIPR